MQTFNIQKEIYCYFFILALLSCDTDEIRFEDLVADVDISPSKQLVANGSDAIRVRVLFNQDADIEKIEGNAVVTNATIQESGTNEIKLTPTRDLENPVLKDQIISEFIIRSTTINSDHRITFNINMFESSIPIVSVKSIPGNVSLSLSSFSVIEDFGSEVILTAFLTNLDGKKVSQGAKVRFSDHFLDGSPVNGRFRNERLSSDDTSSVSAIYTPGEIIPNQEIILKVEVLDNDGNLMGISDSKNLFVSPKD